MESSVTKQMLAATSRIWNGVAWRLREYTWGMRIHCLHRLASLRRRSLDRTIFVGITGSAGKTTAKDLVAAILERHMPSGRKGAGTMNGPDEVARLVLRTRASDTYCVSEIALGNDESIDLQLALFRPSVGIVTNIGGDHVSAYGSLEGIADEKSKLVRSLPDSGIAVLNADDRRVLAMRALSMGAQVITYGMSDHAMLQGSAVKSSWPARLSFSVTWDGRSVRIKTQLCGSHWVPVVLAAVATGVALGVPLTVAAEAVADVEPFEGRMSPVQLEDGVTFIRDDWKAPFWAIAPTFDFMRQARAPRKIIVIGTISDHTGPSTPRYVTVARQALAVADCVMFVGPRASACLRAKREAEPLFAFPSVRGASTFLSAYLRPGDLVLLKGSTRADHLERLILARTGTVECWRSGCGRMHFCGDPCRFLHVPSDPGGAIGIDTYITANPTEPMAKFSVVGNHPEVVVIGLGNPGSHLSDTRHNVGFRVLDVLADRFSGDWVAEGTLAMVCRGDLDGTPICLVKPLSLMNNIGAVLLQIARQLNFEVSQCILVHDDMDLPLGSIRGRNRGSDGGHGGVRSILQAFQDDKFRRVKIGIGKPDVGQSVVDFVLAPFPSGQLDTVDAAQRSAADRVIRLIRDGTNRTNKSLPRDEAT